MTTILADWHLGLMVCDSVASDQHRVWQAKKVFRVHGALIGMAGHLDQFGVFLAWAKTNFHGDAPELVTKWDEQTVEFRGHLLNADTGAVIA